MDSVASVVDRFKGVGKWAQDMFNNFLPSQSRSTSSRCNPIDILKRLQREAFSDLMKLRDRQDKVERLLSFQKSPAKSGPLQRADIRVNWEIDSIGALLMLDDAARARNVFNISGIIPGIHSKLSFQTTVRDNDSLLAEFRSNQNLPGLNYSGASSYPLSLSKVLYVANVWDWLSVVGIPIGARPIDLGNPDRFLQEKSVTDFVSLVPPILKRDVGGAIGIRLTKSNTVASVGRFVSGAEGVGTAAARDGFKMYGEVSHRVSNQTTISIFGLFRESLLEMQRIGVEALGVPLGGCVALRRKSNTSSGFQERAGTNRTVALTLESRPDNNSRFGGWVELEGSGPSGVQFGAAVSETPECGVGWGAGLGGAAQRPSKWDRFWVEGYLRLGLQDGFYLQPGLVYAMDGRDSPFTALVCRSHWSF